MNERCDISDEWLEWYLLTPQERWRESMKLWDIFFSLGGNIEPEPDTDSPFFNAQAWRPLPAHGRSSLRVLRSCGV